MYILTEDLLYYLFNFINSYKKLYSISLVNKVFHSLINPEMQIRRVFITKRIFRSWFNLMKRKKYFNLVHRLIKDPNDKFLWPD
jgi:hypothetical protein